MGDEGIDARALAVARAFEIGHQRGKGRDLSMRARDAGESDGENERCCNDAMF